MIDDIYILFENNGKYFPSYEEAWKNHYKSHIKKVNYVFTPTMQLCSTVSILEKTARTYFNNSVSLDYFDVVRSEGYKQLNFIGDFK